MKIERVELYQISLPLVSSFEISVASSTAQERILIAVYSEGVVGWGEFACGGPWYAYETPDVAWLVLQDYLVPMVMGQSVRATTMRYGPLDTPPDVRDRLAPARGYPFAKHAIETAIWDVWAKQRGISLAAAFYEYYRMKTSPPAPPLAREGGRTSPPTPPLTGEGGQTLSPPSLVGKGAGGLGSTSPPTPPLTGEGSQSPPSLVGKGAGGLGLPDRVRVGVSVGIQKSMDELVNQVGAYLADGYRRVKIKIKPGYDVNAVAALRRHYPDLLLQVDANSVYQVSDAPIFKAMDDYNLLLIEQPLAYDDIPEHAKLQAQLKTAICLDESIHSADHARWAIDMGSCRIINIKPGRVSGFTEALDVHNLCAANGLPVWMGGMLETGVGRAANVAFASLPNFTLPGDISASKRYYRPDIVEPEFELNLDSTLSVPTGPGLGVEVQMDRIQAALQRRATLRT